MLQGTDKNAPPGDIRKWNILDAMESVAMEWKYIMPAVIQNCFAKSGFSTASSVNTNNDNGN
jgi:hypothetical protein